MVYKDSLATSNPELLKWEVEGWSAFLIWVRQDIGPPFDILKVRQAMNMAIDNQAIIDDLYGGYGTMLNFPFAASWGETVYTPVEKQPPEVQEMFEYKPEKARQLLAEAGYPDGFSAKCQVDAASLPASVMSLVKDYWADVGIDLELITLEFSVLEGTFHAKEHESMVAFFKGLSSPAATIEAMFYPGAGGNVCGLEDPIVTDLFDRWQVEMDADTQGALLKQLNNRLVAETPVILLPGYNHFRYAWPWVKNYEGESNSAYLTSVGIHSIIWIDQAMKAEMGY